MASVFLSYDHEDAARAGSIAAALENAGHSVWWDRHIEGGAEFDREIESAVEAADSVVVLWSRASVQSAWVRDEAAEGRDQGKLVPVLLDSVRPPMGFRQFQAIDLVGWKPRQRLPRRDELLRAIERNGNVRAVRAKSPQPVRSEIRPDSRHRFLVWATGASAIAAAFLLLVWNPFAPTEAQAVAAVVPADESTLSSTYARDLLGKLGRAQSNSETAFSLAGAEKGASADFIFEVAASTDGRMVHANLVLRGGPSSILWSSDFKRTASESADLRQQLGNTAAEVLDCAAEAHAAGLSSENATLPPYIRACTEFELGQMERVPELVETFRKAVEAQPRFAAGWSKLLLAELALPIEGEQRRRLQRDIVSARAVDPAMPAADVAEIALTPEGDYARALSLAERALKRHPDDPILLMTRSQLLDGVGRNTDSVNDARRAVDLDPASPIFRVELIYALAAAGRIDGAFRELDEADRLWPGWNELYAARYNLNARYGDPRIARKMGEAQAFTPSWTRAEDYWRARENPTPANIERSLQGARIAYASTPDVVRAHYISILGIFGRTDELRKVMMDLSPEIAIEARFLLFRPFSRNFWRDPRSLEFAKKTGLLQYWGSSGQWPDFCSDRDLPYDCRKEAARLLA